MNKCTHPDKEAVRKCIKEGVEQHRPTPDPKQIRRELGWGLIHVPSDRKYGR